jgi:phosphoglycolate phosphatase
MPRLEGLIFDLDGTLLDSAPDLRQALNATMKMHGRRELTLDEVKGMTGDGMLPMLSRAFQATGKAVSDADAYASFQTFITQYRALPPDKTQIYPLARETLETFSRKNIAIGLCTNKQEAATRQLLQGLDLIRYFGFVAGGDTFPVHKPHPDHVKGVIEGLGVDPRGCAMIGDSPNDIASAQGAGIPCLAVTHGYGLAADLGADDVIDGFSALPDALRELGFEF